MNPSSDEERLRNIEILYLGITSGNGDFSKHTEKQVLNSVPMLIAMVRDKNSQLSEIYSSTCDKDRDIQVPDIEISEIDVDGAKKLIYKMRDRIVKDKNKISRLEKAVKILEENNANVRSKMREMNYKLMELEYRSVK